MPKGFKAVETQELRGALPPWPPPGALPLDPTGALKRAPGPHVVSVPISSFGNLAGLT